MEVTKVVFLCKNGGKHRVAPYTLPTVITLKKKVTFSNYCYFPTSEKDRNKVIVINRCMQ